MFDVRQTLRAMKPYLKNMPCTYRPIPQYVQSVWIVFSKDIRSFLKPSGSWLLGAFAKLRKATTSFVMSVCPHASTFLWNLIFENFFENLPTRVKIFIKNLTNMTGVLSEDLCTFMAVSRSVLHAMKNVSQKSCRENQKHILYSVIVFRKSCHV